jgi:hypothetical protein
MLSPYHITFNLGRIGSKVSGYNNLLFMNLAIYYNEVFWPNMQFGVEFQGFEFTPGPPDDQIGILSSLNYLTAI